MTVEEAKIREEQNYTSRYGPQIARLKLLLRTAAIFLPIALFGAAILVGLIFWVTLMPVLGTIAVVLTIAATFFSILAAFIFFEK
jgi:hypothetical protein